MFQSADSSALPHLSSPPDRLDAEICYQALLARDERFDGRIFVGVSSTGIYCRPVCPAPPARLKHCRFYPSAAAAQQAGFRPCLRCRPETAPQFASWRGTSGTVTRGLSLIAAGELDGAHTSVETLAERLGIGARQLRRLFQRHLGASPLMIAQTRRVLFAKQLLHDTRLPMTEVALAAGFGSVRRFNETFQRLYQRPPSELRRGLAAELPSGTAMANGVTVRLHYRAPYDGMAMFSHWAARAISGVEHVANETYHRTLREDGWLGSVEISQLEKKHCLAATVRVADVRALSKIVARLRNAFDLGADLGSINAHLSLDPALARLVATRPGLRVPGAWDAFELAVRAVLGQQVSVAAARRLALQLVRLAGVPSSNVNDDALSHCFPNAEELLRAHLTALPMPAARQKALRALAEAANDDPHLFQPQQDVDRTVARLRAIPGVGDWTAHYIALRAVREPDAFPASDAGLLRAAQPLFGISTARDLLRRAERWRPFRSYAAQHLWAADAALKLGPKRRAR